MGKVWVGPRARAAETPVWKDWRTVWIGREAGRPGLSGLEDEPSSSKVGVDIVRMLLSSRRKVFVSLGSRSSLLSSGLTVTVQAAIELLPETSRSYVSVTSPLSVVIASRYPISIWRSEVEDDNISEMTSHLSPR